MNQIIVGLLLSLLKKVLTPELVQKYEQQLVAFLEAELANAPELLAPVEKWVVCKLYNLAQKDGSTIGQEVVTVVATALSVDTSTCPAG